MTKHPIFIDRENKMDEPTLKEKLNIILENANKISYFGLKSKALTPLKYHWDSCPDMPESQVDPRAKETIEAAYLKYLKEVKAQ